MIGRPPIIGPRTAIVDSSRIDMLAGLSKAGNRRMPPGFCERAGPQTERLATNPIASLSAPRFAVILLIPCGPWQPAPVGGTIFGMQRLFVEPDVFHAIAVVNAVDHGHEPFDIKLRAGRPTRTSAHLAHICRHRSLGKSVTC